MGYIKEPAGVDFYVDPMPLSTEERKRISEIMLTTKQQEKKCLYKRAEQKAVL